MECESLADDVVACAPSGFDRMRVERRIVIGPGAPFIVLKVALFLIAVILLGGAVVFAYKVVGMLVDAGTKAVDRSLAARNFVPLLSAYDLDAQPSVCAAPQPDGTYYLQQWRSVFVDPRTAGDETLRL
ncbi:hypothetical protein pqer_cds_234 [Pandoravirus quercus]|uniref:Uncharacterized protein n=2 Tax=Pandoravirus TaxID=2060084 RepID=A0A2U7U8A4_9VIRU|nr:hypothetical protein pqer_cds_234 [Pandoravirus quercus]AVK74656.1 hypothetical protein pqer_cds_234 [Pandoravirus quercus]QBZ80834.1 hypothetical protein pclt_cds_236 [Pandoravirus celtis]